MLHKFKRVKKQDPCQICGKPDYCGISDNREIAICMRVESGRKSKNGGWIHFLVEKEVHTSGYARTVTPAPKLPPTSPRMTVSAPIVQAVAADPEERHFVYSTFLSCLTLSDRHRAMLESRGLSRGDIIRHGYASIPLRDDLWDIARRVSKYVGVTGVPGFYRAFNGQTRFVDYRGATGFYIPIRDHEQRIVALQIRRDDFQKPKYLLCSSADFDQGVSSGAPAHHARRGNIMSHLNRPEELTTAIITEGVLKANVIQVKLQAFVIGLIGVGTFDEKLVADLQVQYPSLKHIKIAFDADSSMNTMVSAQLERLYCTLQKYNFETEIITWDPKFKGFDDYLAAVIK